MYKLVYFSGGKLIETLIHGSFKLCKWKMNEAIKTGQYINGKLSILKIYAQH